MTVLTLNMAAVGMGAHLHSDPLGRDVHVGIVGLVLPLRNTDVPDGFFVANSPLNRLCY